MNIVPTFDSTVTDQQWYVDAVNYVVDLFNRSFATYIELDITFGFFTPVGTPRGVARNSLSRNFFDYNWLYAQLQGTSPESHRAASRLPTADPTNGGVFSITTSLQKAYGFGTSFDTDGTVQLNSNTPFSTDFMSPPAPDRYDTAGAIAHELSEVMGRIGACGVHTDSSGRKIFGPMDLFRFQTPGVLDISGGPAQYSLDGNYLELAFNAPSAGSTQDAGDWNFTGDCFGEFQLGVHNGFSTTDYGALRGIGYTGVAAPAPIFAI